MAEKTPEDVAADAFRALEEERFDDFVALLDPAELVRARDEQIRAVGAEREAPVRSALTAAEIRRGRPEMPEAAAEFFAEQHRRLAERQRAVAASAGVLDEEELRRMPVETALARLVRALSPITRLRATFEGKPRSAEDEAALQSAMPRREVIGAVVEGASTAYVVHRQTVNGVPVPGEEAVATLRRTAEGWRLVPHGVLREQRMLGFGVARFTFEPGR